MAKEKKIKKVEIVNRKAKFEFQFLQEYEAGIVLFGTEIKSIRAGNANLKDAFCYIRKGELFIKNMFIGEYRFGTHYNHETRRLRKLLLKKGELKKLERRVKEKGNTIVPYRLFISERGFAKLTLQLSQGKKSYDKRESIKAKDNKREMDRIKRGRF
ncbi:MAG: SsrA-binding protein SmpB [Saprospiraceae bacterium]